MHYYYWYVLGDRVHSRAEDTKWLSLGRQRITKEKASPDSIRIFIARMGSLFDADVNQMIYLSDLWTLHHLAGYKLKCKAR
jgi:hypothetical protein